MGRRCWRSSTIWWLGCSIGKGTRTTPPRDGCTLPSPRTHSTCLPFPDFATALVETARDHARKRVDDVTFNAVHAARQADVGRITAQLAALPTAEELAAPRRLLAARIGNAERTDAALAADRLERLRPLVETF